MLSVLTASGFSLNGGLKSLALSKMQETMLAQIEKETAVDTTKYQAKFDEYQEAAQKFRVVKGRLAGAISNVNSNLDNIAAIKSKLFDMKVLVETAATTTDVPYIADKFDAGLQEINRTADSLPKLSNLIGNNGQTVWNTPELEYAVDDIGTRNTIAGEYLGSDYYIDDTAGKRWVPSWGVNALERYDDFSTDTKADTGSEYYTHSGGLRLDSLSGSDITFTVYPSSPTQSVQYTGTLNKGGLDLMPSWIYEDLNTSTGRTNAAAAVETARTTVDRYEATLKSELAKLEGYSGKLTNTIENFNNDSLAAKEEELWAQARGQWDLQTRYQGMVTTLQSISAAQGGYGRIFKGALRRNQNKLAGALIDQTA